MRYSGAQRHLSLIIPIKTGRKRERFGKSTHDFSRTVRWSELRRSVVRARKSIAPHRAHLARLGEVAIRKAHMMEGVALIAIGFILAAGACLRSSRSTGQIFE